MSPHRTSSFNHHRFRSVFLAPVFALGLALLIPPETAHATIITFAFSGEVTFVMHNGGLLGGNVSVGSPISGVYSFDSDTMDVNPDVRFGEYSNAVTEFSAKLSTIPFFGPSGTLNSIDVVRLSTFDFYSMSSSVELAGASVGFAIGITGDPGALFTNDTLPLIPPALANADTGVFTFEDESIGLNISGRIDSLTLVPEPHSLLILLGLVVVSCKRTK